MFTLIDLVNELGIGAFTGGHVSQATFRLAELFRPADPAGTAVALRHAAYQELLAAEYLRQPASRDTVLATIPRPRLTEETRASLYRRSHPAAPAASGDCVVPAGTYLVGPGHHLMLRRLDHPVLSDAHGVHGGVIDGGDGRAAETPPGGCGAGFRARGVAGVLSLS